MLNLEEIKALTPGQSMIEVRQNGRVWSGLVKAVDTALNPNQVGLKSAEAPCVMWYDLRDERLYLAEVV